MQTFTANRSVTAGTSLLTCERAAVSAPERIGCGRACAIQRIQAAAGRSLVTVVLGPASYLVRSRKAVVIRASGQPHSDGRRQVVGGMLAGLALLGGAPAFAIDIEDERNKSRMAGYDIIYEARELELPQDVRDGLKQARVNTTDTKSRVKESEKRIDTKLEPFIKKAYWTDAREELRLQMGTLRFDLGVLGESFPKDRRKEFTSLKKDLFAAADKLDFAIRQKNQSDATTALGNVKTKLDDVLAKVL